MFLFFNARKQSRYCYGPLQIVARCTPGGDRRTKRLHPFDGHTVFPLPLSERHTHMSNGAVRSLPVLKRIALG